MPKIVNLSLVGSLLLRVLHGKKEDLKGMFLFHRKEFNWFLILLSLISSQAEENVKLPLLLSSHTDISRLCCYGDISVVNMLENLLAGTCPISLLQLHFPSSQKSATVELLNLLLLVVNCANGPICQANYPTKRNNFYLEVSIGCATPLVVCSSACISKLKSLNYPIFCWQGWTFDCILPSKSLPKRFFWL